MREFCRFICGITNFGAGCRVHWGCGIELADAWRAKAGRFNGADVVTWIDEERIGAGTLFLGGIAGGGPRDILVIEVCDCSLGGISGGGLLLPWSDDVVVTFEVMLDVRCKIAVVAFDMVCVMELCIGFDWGWTAEMVVIGFCGGWTFTICGFTCGCVVFIETLLLATGCDDCDVIAEMK